MTLSSTTLWETARDAACRIALEAWTAIEPLYDGGYAITEKVDGPCTEADKRADQLIVERLSLLFPAPEYGYLTEESEDQPGRLTCDRVWIIDPIDGTREFIKHSGNFVIHIGLVERMEDGQWHPVAAAVYRPVAGEMYSAVLGQGARSTKVNPLAATSSKNENAGEKLAVSPRDRIEQMRSVVSNSPQASRLMRLIQSLSLEDYWQIGSLGVKLCTIAKGGAELYINLGRGKSKEWDTCAPHLILTEAGGSLTDLDGQPLTYNHPDVYHQRGLLASNGIIHEALLDLVHKFLEDEARDGTQ